MPPVLAIVPLVLLLAAPAAPPAPRPTPVRAKVVAVHDLFVSEVGAVVWLERTEKKFRLANASLLRLPVRFWRYPEPIREGTWIQLLDRRMRPMGVYAAALPAPGETCGVEVPLIQGLWYLVFFRQEGPRRLMVGHVEVGPRLASLARREGVWELLGLPAPPGATRRTPAPAPTPAVSPPDGTAPPRER